MLELEMFMLSGGCIPFPTIPKVRIRFITQIISRQEIHGMRSNRKSFQVLLRKKKYYTRKEMKKTPEMHEMNRSAWDYGRGGLIGQW